VEFHDAALQDASLEAEVIGDASGEFDVPLLRRAMSNLLANATRFADRGSVVEVRIDSAEAGSVTVAVVNRGPEINPVHLPRLFERFYRADPARGHADLNHGLGLSIVAAIARMHGGHPFAGSEGGCTSIGLIIPAS
jgi:two-component system heavy metal sensor histidine kinase CusS